MKAFFILLGKYDRKDKWDILCIYEDRRALENYLKDMWFCKDIKYKVKVRYLSKQVVDEIMEGIV